MDDCSDDYDYQSGSECSDESEGNFLSEASAPAVADAPSASFSSYIVLDRAKMAYLQREAILSVTGILGCNTSAARALLIYYQWDTETLFGTLAERGQEHVLRAACVTSRSAETATPPDIQGGNLPCGICFCDVPVNDVTFMECNHAFCDECWRQHFQVQISEGKSRRLPCMAVKCGAICDEDKVKQLLRNDLGLLHRYEASLMESYVEDNKHVKWCPSVPHCGRAVQVDGELYCEPECPCGTKFCFACADQPHSPCTCLMWKLWREKCEDDSETKNWMTAHTKPCPKCTKPVEKNGGCNLVVCHCGQAFCWLCGASTGKDHTWTQIYGHSCGRYKEEIDKKIDEAERNIKRYLHYHKHWEAHMASQKLEEKQMAQIQETIEVLEKGECTLRDYSWLTQALQQLFHARRILGYSYVAAFYLFGNDMFRDEVSPEQNTINQNLFEDQQQQLESEVERLSKLIETQPERMDTAMRLLVINSAVNIDKRLTKLYDLIENDLLGTLMVSTHEIAPYKGQSTLRASADGVGGVISNAHAASTSAAAAEQGAPSSLHDGEPVIDLTGTPSPPRSAAGNGQPPAKGDRGKASVQSGSVVHKRRRG